MCSLVSWSSPCLVFFCMRWVGQVDFEDMRYYWPSTKVMMAEYWPSFLFASLWTETKSRSIKMLKRLWSLSSHLDQTSLVNRGFVIICGIKNTLKKMIFVLVFLFFFFSSTEKEASYLQKWWHDLGFSFFHSFILTEKWQKIFFTVKENIIVANEKFSSTHFDPGKILLYGKKRGCPEWAVTLHLASSSSQPHCGIWFILPAHVVCHVVR